MNYLAMNRRSILKIGVLITSIFLSISSHAAGLLQPKNATFTSLSIREHHVSVTIEDGYAITTVEQLFHNPQQQDLEAIYSFPLPEKAVVAEFTTWIDNKPVTGEVVEKNQAKKIYAEEKQAGRDAGLTEKNEYKNFEISVSPVRAGQDTRIRLVYIQAAHIDTGIGRYVYPLENGGVDEQQQQFWSENDTVQDSFSFELTLRSAYPVKALRLPNQDQAKIGKNLQGDWVVRMGEAQNVATVEEAQIKTGAPALAPVYKLDKDIVVYWRLADNLPGSVDLVTYKPEPDGRGTFMLTLTPGDDLAAVNEGKDWIFVLDTSGSMQGKYATLVDGIQQALGKMRNDDRFRIVVFNSSAQEVTSGFVTASRENVAYYAGEVARIQPGNSTNLFAGLKLGISGIDADRSTGVILVTDGVANVGETKQKMFIELLKKYDVRLFTFMMGNSSNRPLLQAMTKASGGFALSVSNSDDIVGKILLATSKITHQALHGVKIQIDGIKTEELTPKSLGSLYRGQQLVVFGHYRGEGLANVKINARVSGQKQSYNTSFEFPAKSTNNPEIERLWAYAGIEDISKEIEDFGETADRKQAIIDIATEYGLVTDYTSMVVVRDEVFNMHGIDRSNQRRTQIEYAARQQRANRAVQSRRVDTKQPISQSPRPSMGSGRNGGAFDAWMLMLLPLILLYRRMTS